VDLTTDTAPGVKIGRKLHDSIVEACNNPVLIEFYNKLKNLAYLTRNITKKSVDIEKESKNAHLNLMVAIEQRDEKKSEACLRSHLRTTCSLLVKTFYEELIQ
jgi:DNA-binding GntR family transcriptional regulator